MADEIEAERQHGGGDAGAAGGDDRFLRINAGGGEFRAELIDRQERAVGPQQLRVGEVE